MKIKFTGEILSTQKLSRYSDEDLELLESINDFEFFGQGDDYIEHHIYDIYDNLVQSSLGYANYKVPKNYSINQDASYSIIEIDPVLDIQKYKYETGEFKSIYNFFRNVIGNSSQKLFINQISGDRTEISAIPVNINNDELEKNTIKLIENITNSEYLPPYLLNFPSNNQILCLNIGLDKSDPKQYKILFKLSKPLPNNLVNKSKFWVVEELTNSVFFNINLSKLISNPLKKSLKGPNFDIKIENNSKNSLYYNYSSLLNSSSSSSIDKLQNYINNNSSDINIDYEITSSKSFDNFVRFSSAQKRINNLWNKISFIETKNNYINIYGPLIAVSSSLSASISIIQNEINNTINSFDGFEKYIYFETGSNTYPKSNNGKPYVLYSTGSSEALAWYSVMSSLSEDFDSENKDNLINVIPNFISEDNINTPYIDFIHMVGHYFDNLWIYIKSVTEIYDNNNNLEKGISKDLIYTLLDSVGLNVYNDYSNDDLYDYIIGSNTGSLDLINLDPTELNTIPRKDLNIEIGKRIYHNLPYLLKNKGTLPGIKALINIFGIPNTLLKINEYGGSDNSSSTYEYNSLKYFNSLKFNNSSKIKVNWGNLANSSNTAKALEFRFKTTNILPSTQSLFILESSTAEECGLMLYHTGSEGGNIQFFISGSSGFSTSSLINGNYFNGEWWNVLINKDDNFDIYLKTKKEDSIYYNLSSSLATSSTSSWDNISNLMYIGGNTQNLYSGSMNGFKFWTTPLNENKFNKHVLNPESYEGNSTTSSYYDLGANFPLGLDVKTYNHYNTTVLYSSHPNQNNTSFSSASILYSHITFINFPDENNYEGNSEVSYINSPNTGTYKRVSDKIRIVNQNIISGSYDNTGKVLLPEMSLEEELDDKYTIDNNNLNISFSPIDEINNDIINSFGHFNIGDYIGNPNEIYNNKYSGLEDLKDEYFIKYSSSYNYNKYNEYVKYFDNSLFKLIENFVPSRSNISTGLIIQSHILERPKYKNISLSQSSTASVSSGEISTFEEGNVKIYGDNSHYWELLSGDRKTFINGEIDNSQINIYNYFISSSFNPYLKDNPSLYGGISKSLDDNYFEKSDFNVLFNNIDQYRSNPNKHILENNGISSSLSTYNEYFNNLTSFKRSRYEGSKSTSLKYNTYTSASYVSTSSILHLETSDPLISGSYYLYSGDNSYGKYAAISSYSNKIGIFTQISENKFFTNKNDISLKYLVDDNGNLVELNQQNINWHEVQSLFKLGEIGTISLFDDQKFTNHKSSNGEKLIFNSGYSYNPIFYIHKDDNLITIQGSVGFIESRFLDGDISGSIYPAVASGSNYYINNIFNNPVINTEGLFTPSVNTPSYYFIPEENEYNVSATISSSISFSQSGSYKISLEILELNEIGSDSYISILGSDTINYEITEENPSFLFYVTGSTYTDISIKSPRYYLDFYESGSSTPAQPSPTTYILTSSNGIITESIGSYSMTAATQSFRSIVKRFYFDQSVDKSTTIQFSINGILVESSSLNIGEFMDEDKLLPDIYSGDQVLVYIQERTGAV